MTTRITDPQGELWFDDDLNLCGDNTDGAGNSFTLTAYIADNMWGNPQPVDVSISSWLRDGAIVVTQGSDNRTLNVVVEVSADSSAALAAGEAALFVRCDKRTTLRYVPPEGSVFAASTVFEVWTSHLEHQYDMDGELHLQRTYALSMTAKPWSRSADLVTTGFAAGGGALTPTLVDACTSTTGWAANAHMGSPVLASSGGQITNTITAVPGDSGQSTMSLIRSGAVTRGATDTLLIQATITGSSGISLEHLPTPATIDMYADGTQLQVTAQTGGTYWCALPDDFTTLEVRASVNFTYTGQVIVLAVQDISLASAAASGYITPREILRNFPIDGSARTTGTITVSHPTSGLGNLIVWTGLASPSGYVPALRKYRNAGPTTPTADATMMSGAYEDISVPAGPTGVGFQLPARSFIEGEYGLVARMKATTPGTYTLRVACIIDGVGSSYIELAPRVALTTSYQLFWLGSWVLPPSAIDTAYTGNVSMIISCQIGSGSGIWLDDLFQFDMTHGAVTVVNTSTSLQCRVDGSDVERIQPTIWLGASPNLTDSVAASLTTQVMAFAAGAAGPVGHVFPPGGAQVFVACDGTATSPAVSLSYYPRWHTHAVT